jgi:hypothetical protein
MTGLTVPTFQTQKLAGPLPDLDEADRLCKERNLVGPALVCVIALERPPSSTRWQLV